MYSILKESLFNQFGASIDMLINVVSNSPDGYFQTHPRFYYIAFHSTIFLDYYLTIPPSEFLPLLSYTRKEAAGRPIDSIDDLIPDRIYNKQELTTYMSKSRVKCKKLIESLSQETINERFIEGTESSDMNYPILEILLYNMRHTQHHVAQLNLLIRQDLHTHMEWSFKAGDIDIEK